MKNIKLILLEYCFSHAKLRPKQGPFHLPKMQVSFTMAIGNVEVMHKCSNEHMRRGTARMK